MENPTSTIESVLSSFGGLCVELDSPDLPEGASPLNQDVDFLVGAVVTRPGVSNVYAYTGNSQTFSSGLGVSIGGSQTTQTASITLSQDLATQVIVAAVFKGASNTIPPNIVSTISSGNGTGSAVTTISTGTFDVLTGQLIAIAFRNNESGAGRIVSTVTDTIGNNYFRANGIIDGQNLELWYAVASSSASGVTATATLNTADTYTFSFVWVVNGCQTSSPLDVSATGSSTLAFTVTSASFVNTTPTAIVLAVSSTNRPNTTFTPGGNFILDNGTFPSSSTSNYGGAEHLALTPGGSSPWTNPDNIASQLSATVSLAAGQASTLLQASLYPFTIPSTSAITGIQVDVTGAAYASGIPSALIPYYNLQVFAGQSPGTSGSPNFTLPTPNARTNSTPYSVGALIFDINNNVQRCTTSGTTAGSPPSWATSVGLTTSDGSVVWTCVKYMISVGDTILVVPNIDPDTTGVHAGPYSITAITSTSTGTWTSFTSPFTYVNAGGRNATIQGWSATATTNLAAGATLTLNWTNNGVTNTETDIHIVGFTGIGTISSPVGGSNTSVSTWSSGSLSITSQQLLFSVTGAANTVNLGSGSPFTAIQVGVGGNQANLAFYIPGASGSYADSWQAFSGSTNETSFMVAITYAGSNSTPTNGSATIAPNSALTASRALALPTLTGTVTVGSPTDNWGQVWTPALINSPAFGFSLQGFASTLPASFSINNISVTVWYTPPNPRNFNYIKSFTQSSGDSLTLALDAVGDIWQEDVQNTPNQLTPIFTAIEPNTFAVSCTAFEKEYIALSNLANGTDMPRQYNGRWIDRVSQVGPGVGPTVSFTATGYPITSITQPAAVSSLTAILWSSGPGTKAAAGNVITIYYGTGGTPSPASAADPNIVVGGCVYLSGFPTINGQNVTGTYVVVSVQTTLGYNGHYWNTFCVQAGSSQLYDSFPASLGSASYNATVATLTTSTPIPNVTAGSQLSVTSASVPAWDETWTITGLVNAAQLQITNTQLTFNASNPAQSTATYNYLVDAGAVSTFQPSPGAQVTIQYTTNGNGIFNGNNFSIASVSPLGSGVGSTGTFSVLLPATADVHSQSEQTGSGFINGTQFRFEPGLGDVGTANNPILGNSTGGSVTQAGNLGSGTRQAVVFFQTRNGYLTQPSAPVSFTLSESANSITVANVPIGPPNVIARCIAFTGANGSNFFYIPQPVIVTINNQPTTYSATVINDNITTSATFTFTDAILLAATGIDIQGNDLFNQLELDSSLGSVLYASRVFWWGEQNKVPNFVNMSFDGGYLSTTTPMPAGWTALNVGGSLVASPQFGNAYYIQNTSGSNQSTWGLIVQSAYQDAYGVPIIFPQTQYSVRVTASCPSGVTSGQLSIQIASGSVIYGIINFPLANMTTSLQILTGTLLSTPFATQPPADIQLKVYAGLPNGGDVLIDRIEVYPSSQPNLPTQLRASYVDNPEAFDQNTGVLGVGSYNNQPVTGAFILHDNLYILKSRSMEYTIDNGTTEPYLWQVRQVSNKVGTPSIHGYDYGEEWAVIAAYDGVYVFGGGVPQKISQEIQPIWDSINWQYGNTIWVRNDISNKRVYIGVPIATPNKYMPQLPANANPTSPNVILCMSYREVNSVEELANRPPIHLTYTGKLVSWDLSRKWTVWNIQAPYGDFCIRPDTTEKLLICNGIANSKIYQLVPGQFNDDGAAINSNYTTYGFVKSDIGQATGLGAHNMFLLYGSMLVKGNGNLNVTEIPNTLDSPNAAALLPIPLYNPNPNGDTELPLNDNGCRFFIQVGTDAPNSWFQLSKMVLSMKPSLYPVRGAY